jgi:hypothetical protein
MNTTFCVSNDTCIAASVIGIFYVSIVGILLAGGSTIKQCFQEFAQEAAVERYRQSKMIDRLLLHWEEEETDEV